MTARPGSTTRAQSSADGGDLASTPRVRDGAIGLPVGTVIAARRDARDPRDGLLRLPRAGGPWLGRPKPARRVSRLRPQPGA